MPITLPLLFDDQPAATPIDGTLVQRSKTPLLRNKKERAVSRLLAQVESLRGRLEEARVESAPVRCKTKRELREAERAQCFEQMRKISIGAIYKRLARALHPDLERDPSLRERKSALMQDVTTAYAASDLQTLLRLELEWIDGEGTDAARRTDETLDACAQLLRQQVAQLRAECMELPFHPRYQTLLAGDNPFDVGLVDGPAEVQRLDAALEGLSTGLARLSDERHGWRELRELILMHRRERGRRSRRR